MYGFFQKVHHITIDFHWNNLLLGLFFKYNVIASTPHFMCEFFINSFDIGIYFAVHHVVHEEVANRSILPGYVISFSHFNMYTIQGSISL